uniref:Uncharacterized protein n=1 Tax=Knipowitschia caucasica TaxID=637954 RepID=A0AAV2LB12_KNICA
MYVCGWGYTLQQAWVLGEKELQDEGPLGDSAMAFLRRGVVSVSSALKKEMKEEDEEPGLKQEEDEEPGLKQEEDEEPGLKQEEEELQM